MQLYNAKVTLPFTFGCGRVCVITFSLRPFLSVSPYPKYKFLKGVLSIVINRLQTLHDGRCGQLSGLRAAGFEPYFYSNTLLKHFNR